MEICRMKTIQMGEKNFDRKSVWKLSAQCQKSAEGDLHEPRQWHSTPVLLPRKSHGWRSLVGCSPWGR